MKPEVVAGSLLIRNVNTLVTMDAEDRQIRGGFLYAEQGKIRLIGQQPPRGLRAQRTIEAPTCIAVPGLINTHPHLFQTHTRAVTATADEGRVVVEDRQLCTVSLSRLVPYHGRFGSRVTGKRSPL